MGRGGARAGAGRKAGVKMPTIRRINVDEIMNRVGTGPDKMPLPFLLAIMHAPPEETSGVKMSERIQCAIAAAPYCHARLASVEVKAETRSTIQTQSDLASALKDLARIARLREAPVIDGDILEAAASKDKMSAGHNDRTSQTMDIMSEAHTEGVDIMTAHTEGEDDGGDDRG